MGAALADQFLVSAGNFAYLSLSARALTPMEFGALAVVQTVVVIVLGFLGATFNEVVLLNRSKSDGLGPVGDGVDSAVAAAYTSAAVAVLVALSGVALDGALGDAVLVLAAVLPFVALQDALRYRYLAAMQPRWALFSDSVAILLWVSIIELAPFGKSAWAFTLALGCGSAVAVVTVLAFSGATLKLRTNPLRQLKLNQRIAKPLLGEYMTIVLVGQLTMLVVAGVLGLAATGGLRAAQAVFGPLNTLQNAVRVAVTPELMAAPDDRKLMARRLRALSIVTFTVTAVFLLVALNLPNAAGENLFGATWTAAGPLLLAVGAQRVFGALQVGPLVGLRATGHLSVAAIIRSGAAVLSVTLTLVAVATGSVVTVAWAATTASGIGSLALAAAWSRHGRGQLQRRGSSGLAASGQGLHASPSETS